MTMLPLNISFRRVTMSSLNRLKPHFPIFPFFLPSFPPLLWLFSFPLLCLRHIHCCLQHIPVHNQQRHYKKRHIFHATLEHDLKSRSFPLHDFAFIHFLNSFFFYFLWTLLQTMVAKLRNGCGKYARNAFVLEYESFLTDCVQMSETNGRNGKR